MGAVPPIIRLPGWQPQEFLHERQIEVEEEGAVKEQEVSLSPLGIAGEFPVIDGQIGMALNLHLLTKRRRERLPVRVHDE